MAHTELTKALSLIFDGINRLKAAFPNRKFTIDGRLVGDIGEVIAALKYDVKIDDVSQATYDGITSDGRRVQIKATFKDSLTLRSVPDYYLGFKLYPDGSFEEIYNGPGRLIFDKYAHRKGIGTTLLSFPIVQLKALDQQIPPDQRIPKRTA